MLQISYKLTKKLVFGKNDDEAVIFGKIRRNEKMVKTHYDCPCLEKCPLSKGMELIGGKWKMQIICSLNNSGKLRYNELRRKLDGVSNTALARALRELEEAGLIERTEYLEVPVRVEYHTTEICDELIPILDQFSDWYEKVCERGGENK